jgi:hypothetical protein
MVPYWIWGNNQDDTNPVHKRIHPQSEKFIEENIIEPIKNAHEEVKNSLVEKAQEVGTAIVKNAIKSALRCGANKALDYLKRSILPHY